MGEVSYAEAGTGSDSAYHLSTMLREHKLNISMPNMLLKGNE